MLVFCTSRDLNTQEQNILKFDRERCAFILDLTTYEFLFIGSKVPIRPFTNENPINGNLTDRQNI